MQSTKTELKPKPTGPSSPIIAHSSEHRISIDNTAQNSSDNVVSYPPDNHYSWDVNHQIATHKTYKDTTVYIIMCSANV